MNTLCGISLPLRHSLVLSMSFMLVYTAYLAIQNLQSSLNQEANLGVASLSVLYGTIILFGTQAPNIIKLLSAKRVIMLAWLIHIIYTCSNFYPTWGTLIPSSGLMGAIAAPMWTSQGLYITSFGEAYASLKGLTSEEGLHSVLSKLNGIFFMFYEVTQVTGNLISSLVLSSDDSSSGNSSSSRVDVSLCGANDCPSSGSTTDANSTSNSDQPHRQVIYTLLGVFLVFNISGFLLTTCALPKHKRSRINDETVSPSPCDNTVSCFRMVVDPKMIPLLPLFMAQAMAIGVLYADYTKAFITCTLGVEWVGFIMAFYGFLCAFFAIAINSLAKFFGRITLFMVAILMDTSTLLIMLLWQPSQDSHLALFFIVPGLSGISEGILQAQFNTLVAQLFKTNMSSAFATYHTSKAASFTITFTMSLVVCLRQRLMVALTLYGLGLVGYLWTELRVKRGHWYDQCSTDSGAPSAVATAGVDGDVCDGVGGKHVNGDDDDDGANFVNGKTNGRIFAVPSENCDKDSKINIS